MKDWKVWLARGVCSILVLGLVGLVLYFKPPLPHEKNAAQTNINAEQTPAVSNTNAIQTDYEAEIAKLGPKPEDPEAALKWEMDVSAINFQQLRDEAVAPAVKKPLPGEGIFPYADPKVHTYLDVAYEPAPCERISDEDVRPQIEGYTFAKAIHWLLSSPNPGQHQYAYRMVTEVTQNTNLHSGDDFDIYPYVFCGEGMKRIATHVITDAFDANGREVHRMNARNTLRKLDIVAPALLFIEERLKTGEDQIELVQLARIWIEHRLERIEFCTDRAICGDRFYDYSPRMAAAEGIIADLRRLAPGLQRFTVVDRAIEMYRKTTTGCGGFCPLDGAKLTRETEQEKEEEYFLYPFWGCPPEHLLQEMQLSRCPMRPPT